MEPKGPLDLIEEEKKEAVFYREYQGRRVLFLRKEVKSGLCVFVT